MIFSRGKGLLEGNTVTHRENRNNISHIIHPEKHDGWKTAFLSGCLFLKG